ncbi:crustacean hyperglycemic hormone-like [Penaeus indicus]|uniref:crustacean hyperglycemic hormone-like n=1 Tax=Penaeus indicus TaxID=29960 RepID=UPI00300C2C3E
MVAVQLVQSAVLVSLLVAFPVSVTTSENSNETPTFILSSPGDSHTAQSINKRTVSFSSCTGVYDRELLVRLDRVCEDCYNLYRDVGVAAECRRNCFHNEVFLYCVDYMFRPRQRNQYRAALQRLGK